MMITSSRSHLENDQRNGSGKRISRNKLMEELDFINPFPVSQESTTIVSCAFRAYLYKNWLMIGIDKLQNSLPEHCQASAAKSLTRDNARKRKMELETEEANDMDKTVTPDAFSTWSLAKSNVPHFKSSGQDKNLFETEYYSSHTVEHRSLHNVDSCSAAVRDHLFQECRPETEGCFNMNGSGTFNSPLCMLEVILADEDLTGSSTHTSNTLCTVWNSLGKDSPIITVVPNTPDSLIAAVHSDNSDKSYSASLFSNSVHTKRMLMADFQSPKQSRLVALSVEELQDLTNTMESPQLIASSCVASSPAALPRIIHNCPASRLLSPWNTCTPEVFSPSISSVQEVVKMETPT